MLATRETLAIMGVRYGARFRRRHAGAGVWRAIGIDRASRCSFHPAGHVLGSAQIAVEAKGMRIVVSGDYKRRARPDLRAVRAVPCDVFISEATFGLPVFRHPDAAQRSASCSIRRRLFPERAHLVGAYSLGKAQRVIALLREAGYDRPIYIHGAMEKLTRLYEREGIALGELSDAYRRRARPSSAARSSSARPRPSHDRWARRFPDPVPALASGWMRVRARARQRGVELPLVISDHADWDELCETIGATGAPSFGSRMARRMRSCTGRTAKASPRGRCT